jgi:hypothetical protein
VRRREIFDFETNLYAVFSGPQLEPDITRLRAKLDPERVPKEPCRLGCIANAEADEREAHPAIVADAGFAGVGLLPLRGTARPEQH